MRRPRRWLPIYIAWIAFCAVLFIALRNAEDPSRPTGQILSIEAGRMARDVARSRGYAGYEVVHVARARAGEGEREERWVVLLDEVPHTNLKRAVVVELDLESGKVLRIRRPSE